MDHEISHLERRGRLGCSEDFDQRLFAETCITRTNINVVSKRRVKRIGFDAELLDSASGLGHHIGVVVIKMRRERTNLNDVKTAFANCFQAAKDVLLGKTTGG